MPERRSIVRPLVEFLRTEAAGGVVLLIGAAAALAWANSPWRETYEKVWQAPLIGTRRAVLPHSPREWVNEGLMTLFFFVVGLEIKRELVAGELRDRRAAALPVLAAVGGMAVPAALFLAINPSGPEARGWAIPMATDIAFAVGLLSVSLTAVPSSLKTFLLALAIVDDIGAIVVIALFYSEGISLLWLAAAAGLVLVIGAVNRLSVESITIYAVLAVGVWFATMQSGVHATIAGVAVGLVIPVRSLGRENEPPDEGSSLLARLERGLHPWTSFAVVPLFALANAGISVSPSLAGDALTGGVALGVIIGLVFGKPIGIALGAWLGIRTRVATLPAETEWKDVWSIGAIGGVGFTVSLFIATLAFPAEREGDAARLGILVASIVAGALGWVLVSFWRGRRTARQRPLENG